MRFFTGTEIQLSLVIPRQVWFDSNETMVNR